MINPNILAKSVIDHHRLIGDQWWGSMLNKTHTHTHLLLFTLAAAFFLAAFSCGSFLLLSFLAALSGQTEPTGE
jgi:Na+-translocating ferredoxin:NAD+ oxidoreductase RnfE subunit